MSTDDLKWLAGIFLPALTFNVSLINLSLNDKFRYPIRWAFLLNFLYAAIGGGFAYFVTQNLLTIIGVVIENSLLLGIFIFMLKQRDVKGISLGEDLIEFGRLADVQASYIWAALVEKKPSEEINEAISHGLDYILYLLGEILGFEDKRNKKNPHHSLSILLARDNGKFDVLAYDGITYAQIEHIKESFRHKPEIVSVAGYAVNTGKFACIPNLEDQTNYLIDHWVPAETNERKEGFLLCYPIFSGVGRDSHSRPIAVICLSSRVKNAYDGSDIREILDRFSPKIENMIYAHLMINSVTL
jgi:hypothetical protein